MSEEREVSDLKFVEFDATEAITLRDGRVIDARVQAFDTANAYGDDHSVAEMLGDTVDRNSSDSSQGVQAYEAAREQLDQDFDLVKEEARDTAYKSKRPMAELFWDYDSAGVLRGVNILTAWGRTPWSKLEPRMDYITLDEMDRVDLEKTFGIKVNLNTPTQ
jgi:hypothetical protein